MDLEALQEQIINHEGVVLHAYKDSEGYLTIGVGRMIDERLSGGITYDEAMYLLDNDIKKHTAELEKIFDDFYDLPEDIQHVLVDMHFNLGDNRFRTFKKMIAAVKDRDWHSMKTEMLDSLWARQVGRRATNLANMVDKVVQEEV